MKTIATNTRVQVFVPSDDKNITHNPKNDGMLYPYLGDIPHRNVSRVKKRLKIDEKFSEYFVSYTTDRAFCRSNFSKNANNTLTSYQGEKVT